MCNHDSGFNIVRTKDNHMITDVICADCNESLMEIIAEQKEVIEQQNKYAELGRLAVEEIDNLLCKGKFKSDDCSLAYNYGCAHEKYCQLRAELLKVEGCE